MAMTKRARSRGLKKTQQLLGTGADVRSYGVGVIGPDPRRTIALIVLVFGVAIALSFVFLNVIIIPSVLLVLVIFGAVDRPASFAMTDRGMAVFARSELTGRPRKFLTVLPSGVLTGQGVKQSTSHVHLPEFHLWLRTKEYDRILSAADNKVGASQWAPPVAAGVTGQFVGVPTAPPVSIGPAPAAESDVIYCSWCGQERRRNAPAIHYCGSMQRPPAFCMNCGAALEEGASTCTSCGTPVTTLSR
jgi:hypothetical protein